MCWLPRGSAAELKYRPNGCATVAESAAAAPRRRRACTAFPDRCGLASLPRSRTVSGCALGCRDGGWIASLDGEHLGLVGDLVDRERLGLLARHAGRTVGHARQRDALDVRALLEELVDGADRHVALDHVAADQHGVATAEFFRHAV